MKDFQSNSSHWGSFDARLTSKRKIEIAPPAIDTDPSPLLESFASVATHPNRLRQPLIRRAWLEGRRNDARAERGRTDFVPVTWDTALDHVAAELLRVRETYGNDAIFGGSYGWSSAGRFHHAKSQLHRFLNCFGGFVDQEQNYSYAAGKTFLPHVVGSHQAIEGPVSTLDGIAENCEIMLCFGGISPGNMQVEAGGSYTHPGYRSLRNCVQHQVRLVSISPTNNELPEGVAAEWIPIRPNTDTAMMLAMCHVLIRENRIDTDFLARCCIGQEHLIDYVLGRPDGVPKSSVWASAITGIPAHKIERLARELTERRSFINISWALQRADHGEQPLWAAIALACLVGQIGLPGGGFAFGLWSISGQGHPRLRIASPRLPMGVNPVSNRIPVARISDMLLHPGDEYDFNGERRRYADIRLIYWCGGNPFHHHQDINRLIEAFRRPEAVIVQDIFFTSTARHADIVLPATTTLERNDIGASPRDPVIVAMKRVMPAFAHSRTDFDIFCGLAERLGIADTFTEGRTEMEWLNALYDTFQAGAQAEGITLPNFKHFWDNGQVRLPAPKRPYTLFENFRREPESAPLATPSGRIELYSERIAAWDYDDCPGHPTWLEPTEWLSEINRQEGKLHLITSQPKSRLHSQLDPGSVSVDSKIGGREPCWIHPDDAAARSIHDGDIVRVWNTRGAVLAGALVTQRVMPGVALIATGAWYDPVDPGCVGSLDKHGNSNVLTLDKGSSRLSQAPISQTTLVQIEHYSGPLPGVSAHNPPDVY